MIRYVFEKKEKMITVVSDHFKCAFHCRDNVHRTCAMPCNSQNASRLANDFKKCHGRSARSYSNPSSLLSFRSRTGLDGCAGSTPGGFDCGAPAPSYALGTAPSGSNDAGMGGVPPILMLLL